MNLKSRQRGALIIVAIVILVVTAALATALSFLSASTNLAGANHQLSAQALAIAQAGLERASYQLGLAASPTGTNGTACATAALNNTNVAVGNGSFTTTSQIYQKTAGQALSGALTNVATSIPLTTTGFAPHGRVRIDNEEINYSGLTATALTGATRGSAGTTAAAHLSGALVKQDLCLIRSTGTVGNANRILEQTLHDQDAMIVYAKELGVTTTPFYRRWTGAGWNAIESSAVPIVTGTTIQFMRLAFSRTRNEAIMVLTDTNGKTAAQVWDGFAWGNQVALGTVNTSNLLSRNFGLAYETNGDRAVVVFNDGTRNPKYKVWSGSGWSNTGSVATDMGLANYPTGAQPSWIVVRAAPAITSNSMSLITDDSANDITGATWNGSLGLNATTGVAGGWQVISVAQVWETNASGNTNRAIDIAYENLSGKPLFAWGYSTTRRIRYFSWDGVSALPATNAFPSVQVTPNNKTIQWVRLAAQRGSNKIMYAGLDNSTILNAQLWDGSAGGFDATTSLTLGTTVSKTNETFDLTFETYVGNQARAWLVSGDTSAAGVTFQYWTSGAVWTTAASAAGTRRTDFVELQAHPSTGNLFAGLYEANQPANPQNLNATQLTGGGVTWAATTSLYNRNSATNDIQGRMALGARKVIPIDWQEIFP